MSPMNAIKLFAVILMSVVLAMPGNALTLFEGSKKDITIVIGNKATASERFAAQELSRYLNKITGKQASVRTDLIEPDNPYICVGLSRFTKSLPVDSLGIEDYIIRADDNKLIIVGGRQEIIGKNARDRGTLYGVYSFLESLGVRWYRPDEWGEYVPSLKTIKVKNGSKTYKPGFAYRSGLQSYRSYRAWTPEQDRLGKLWATRMRMNVNMWTGPEYGGYYFRDYAHSYFQLIPHSYYFKDHPEYFALIDGKRSENEHAQLCLSNPELQKLFISRIKDHIKQYPYQQVIAIEPNDGSEWCQCDNCKAMDDPNLKTNAGGGVSMSNRVCAFGNIVAKEIAKEHPEVKMGWLTYNMHTEVPTIVKQLEPNVALQSAAYAAAYSDYSRKLRDSSSGQNSAFLKVIEGYSKLCSDLTTYEYWQGYCWLGPMPVVNVMVDRLREYKKMGIQGVYNQVQECHWGSQGINYYMYCKLMWDPDLDYKKELNLYYKNFYGPAEKPMKAYHELLEQVASSGWWCSGGYYFWTLLTPDVMAKLDGYIKQAQKDVQGKQPYQKRMEGVWAGFEFAKRYRNMQDLSASGLYEAAAKEGDELVAFAESYKDGSVFDIYPWNEGYPGESYTWMVNDVKEVKSRRADSPFINPALLLPLDSGWKFIDDPKNSMDTGKLRAVDFNDKGWKPISVNTFWESQGYPSYDGIGWYRLNVEIPALPDSPIKLLYFGSVDGDAELWLDGQSLGKHEGDKGDGEGWQTPFWFDVTSKLTPGKHTLAIKVTDSEGMGGIWKGVKILGVDGLK